NQNPTARFDADPTSGQAPLAVTFDASASADPDGQINAWTWEFGDGSTGSGEGVTHTYTQQGTYTVKLTVTDDDGAEAAVTKTNLISVQPDPIDPNQNPTALFDADPTSGQVPLAVTFDASASADPDGQINAWTWEFGDGSTGSGESVMHTYTQQGTYTVKLTVTDDDGAEAAVTKTNLISVQPDPIDPNQNPTARFDADPTSGQAPLAVTFDASASADPDGQINAWTWEFGDGST
ncbi:MAG: PKD domain-containing protein, partial [Desulfobacterales bacterium]|nr:PKD domain-containing protein [Desulfobacterales bacterium]